MSATAASSSRRPRSSKGVTIAVRMAPKFADIAGIISPEVALVHAPALDQAAAHRLQPAVHRSVDLENEAGLACLLAAVLGGLEVLVLQGGGDAGVLVLGQHTQKADPEAVDDAPAQQVVEPAERQQPAVHLLVDLVDVRDRDRHRDRLTIGLGD